MFLSNVDFVGMILFYWNLKFLFVYNLFFFNFLRFGVYGLPQYNIVENLYLF